MQATTPPPLYASFTILITSQLRKMCPAKNCATYFAAAAGAAKPHWPCSILSCLVMRFAFCA
jgi:hypothetical protein